MQGTVKLERLLNAPVDIVWKALTDADEMRKWYFDISRFELTVGNKFGFSGTGSDGTKYEHICQVKEIIPQRKLSYTWAYKDFPGESLLTFELTSEGNKTRLNLVHSGLNTFPEHPDFSTESFTGGWTHIMGSLSRYVESSH